MALGEVLGESKGKVVGMKVLPDGRVEVTFQGSGRLLGIEISDLGTYTQSMRANGSIYGDGQVVIMSSQGAALWKGSGTGRPTGQGFGAKYAYGGIFVNAPEKSARLLDVYTAGEYTVDQAGNYQWKLWEWKA